MHIKLGTNSANEIFHRFTRGSSAHELFVALAAPPKYHQPLYIDIVEV